MIKIHEQQLTEKTATKLELDFARELGTILGMETNVAVLTMFRNPEQPKSADDLNNITIYITGHSGKSRVEQLAMKYGIGRSILNFRSRGRARSSVHDRTGRTPGARGHKGGDYNRLF